MKTFIVESEMFPKGENHFPSTENHLSELENIFSIIQNIFRKQKIFSQPLLSISGKLADQTNKSKKGNSK